MFCHGERRWWGVGMRIGERFSCRDAIFEGSVLEHNNLVSHLCLLIPCLVVWWSLSFSFPPLVAGLLQLLSHTFTLFFILIQKKSRWNIRGPQSVPLLEKLATTSPIVQKNPSRNQLPHRPSIHTFALSGHLVGSAKNASKERPFSSLLLFLPPVHMMEKEVV